ncbi:FtsX-like permease family protein [Umezawaea tangerina]|uniref:Putative ABC transport system permease protein n=1 Tax=Umezawaea tangerina TaxID=84725 RepID=A0A2T0T6I4_9PSEU|nr:ABC transporter permease [Umezawaea tangerina]PRY41297.1 putative ABC transport system permease protein [Umezawaea tangerina]
MGLAKSTLRQIRRRPSRLLLTGVALLVATSFLSGSVVLRSSLRAAVIGAGATTTASTDVVVTTEDRDTPLTDDDLTRIAAAPGVNGVSPVTYGPVLVEGTGRAPKALHGIAMEGPMSPVRLVEGTPPRRPDEVALPPGLAERLHARVGTSIVVHPTSAPAVTVRVSAIAAVPDGLRSAVLTTPANARTWLDTTGWQRVDTTSADPAATVRAIEAGLGGQDVLVRTGAGIRAEDEARALESVDSVFLLLLAFIAVALMAAAVIVSSTFRVLLTRDQKRLALLRCVGARPGQVVRAVVTEAALSGLVAGVAGAALAVGAVRGGLAVATASGVAKVPALSLPWAGIPLCVAVSVLLAVVAALPAALAAARVPPVAALSGSAVRDTADRIGVPRVLLAAGSVATAAFLGVVAHLGTGVPDVVVLSAVGSGLALFGGLLALGPLLLRKAAPVLTAVGRGLGGLPGRLAAGNVVRVPRRSAACAAVVALGTTMVCAVLVVLASLEDGSHDKVYGRSPSDAVIACWSSDEQAAISPAVVDAVRAVPLVGAVVPVRRTTATVGASSTRTSVGSPDLTVHPRLPHPDGGWSPGRIALSHRQAEALAAEVGERIAVTLSGRTATGVVAMVFPDDVPLDDVVLHPADMAALAPEAPIRSLLVNAADGVDPAALHGPLDAAVPLDPLLRLDFPADERAADQETVDALRLVALALVGLTVLVSVVGVAVALGLSVLERTREAGVLRALGLRGSGLRSVIAWEAGLLALCAIVPGLLLGTGYGALTTRALPDFDAVTVPFGQLAVTAACSLLLTLLAAVIPARRAARTSPMSALRNT